MNAFSLVRGADLQSVGSELRVITKRCSVPDCQSQAEKRGWCSAHYHRWQRHGDPLGGGDQRGLVLKYYREVVLAYEGDECLIWPYGKSEKGYAKLSSLGGSAFVSRHVCEEVNGPPPTQEHHAAHSCGKGHLACVTKRHMSWKTPAENEADKLLHGTSNRGERHGRAKLTEQAVREIRELRGVLPQTEIAERYSVHQVQISRVQLGKDWDPMALRVITKKYGGLLGPTYTVAFGDKYYAVGELTLNQLKRGVSPEELDLFEVDPDAEDDE